MGGASRRSNSPAPADGSPRLASEPELREEDFSLRPHNHKGEGVGSALEEIEKSHILRVLEECSYNQTRAADILRIDRATLHNKLKKYGWSKPVETR